MLVVAKEIRCQEFYVGCAAQPGEALLAAATKLPKEQRNGLKDRKLLLQREKKIIHLKATRFRRWIDALLIKICENETI